MVQLHNDWDALLSPEFQEEYYRELRLFLAEAYRTRVIYPGMYDIFNALRLTAFTDVKVVIVGQDPYINPGEAHGLAFSVQPGARVPPSLANIFKELATDVDMPSPPNGCLIPWAERGVLLLNTVLTVEARKSRSHAGRGWERFTDAVLAHLNEREKPVVFMLWGRDAQNKGQIISEPRHLVLQAAHPSPLAGGRFFGCRHFSQANAFLDRHGLGAIDWTL